MNPVEQLKQICHTCMVSDHAEFFKGALRLRSSLPCGFTICYECQYDVEISLVVGNHPETFGSYTDDDGWTVVQFFGYCHYGDLPGLESHNCRICRRKSSLRLGYYAFYDWVES